MKKLIALFMATIMLLALFAGCGSAAAPSESAAETDAGEKKEAEYNFSIHQNDPATSAAGLMLEAWAQSIRDASDGRIDFTIYHGGTMGGVTDTYDLVTNGTCDIALGNCSYFPGNFALTEVLMLPMSGITGASHCNYVMWNLYKQFPEIAAEYEEFYTIGVFGNCTSPISTKDLKLTEISQLEGMNIRGNSGPPTTFIESFGAAPVSVKITELYNAIDNNTIDAVITDWHAIKSFALYEPLNYYCDELVSVTPFFFVWNLDSYNKLPDDLKAVVDSCSGDNLLSTMGTYWDDVEAECRQLAVENGGEIYTLPEAEHEKLLSIAEETKEAWIAAKEADGYSNAAEIVEAMFGFVEEYA